MRDIGSKRPSGAFITALLALVVALGGTAIAAKKLGGSEIRNDAIKSKHIADDAVRSKAIKDGKVTGAKLADGAVSEAKLADDARSVYARVDQAGTTLSQGPGVIGVQRAAIGVYCFDLAAPPNAAVGSIDQATAGALANLQTAVPAVAICPAPFTDASVLSFGPLGGAANNGFFVQFE